MKTLQTILISSIFLKCAAERNNKKIRQASNDVHLLKKLSVCFLNKVYDLGKYI